MKNIIFWAGLFVATFWDEILLASVKPEKTKRQQQFFETGETAQAFIGAVDNEFMTGLKKLFTVKKIPKKSIVYDLVDKTDYFDTVIYIINKGIQNGFVLFVDYYKDGRAVYQIFYGIGEEYFYDDDTYFPRTESEKILFGNSVVRSEVGNELDMIYAIWNNYIRFYKKEIGSTIEGKNVIQFFERTSGDAELGFYLLQSVPNIKKILS